MISRIRSKIFLIAAAAMLCGTAAGQEWTPGLSEPEVDTTLGFQTGGTLANLAVRDGQAVKAGELLAELDNEQEKLEVERRALVMQAAKKDYERTKEVFDNGKSISREELEQKEATYKVAEVEHKIAQTTLGRRQLKAPCDGVITEHFDLSPGESVQPNSPVIRIVTPDRCRFTCHVKGSAAHGLAEGKAVQLKFEMGGKEVLLDGKVDFVSPTVDASSGLQLVKAIFANPNRAITPGISGMLKLKGP